MIKDDEIMNHVEQAVDALGAVMEKRCIDLIEMKLPEEVIASIAVSSLVSYLMQFLHHTHKENIDEAIEMLIFSIFSIRKKYKDIDTNESSSGHTVN